MNIYQTIFTLFIALYFAVTISLTSKLQLFDTPSMCKIRPHWYPQTWLRFIYSIVFLDLCPILYFGLVFIRLQNYCNQMPNLITIILLFWSSLIGQGFYRFLYGSMLLKFRNNYIFYDKSLFKKANNRLPDNLYNDLKERPVTHKVPIYHIIPGLLWIISAILTAIFIS